MTSVEQHPPVPSPLPPRRPWFGVVVTISITVPFALIAALVGWQLLHPFGGDPILDWGNGLWVLSAGLLGVGIAAPPGPARRPRLSIGAAVAVVRFVVGRFVLGPWTWATSTGHAVSGTFRRRRSVSGRRRGAFASWTGGSTRSPSRCRTVGSVTLRWFVGSYETSTVPVIKEWNRQW
jgi:hypothetical protein